MAGVEPGIYGTVSRGRRAGRRCTGVREPRGHAATRPGFMCGAGATGRGWMVGADSLDSLRSLGMTEGSLRSLGLTSAVPLSRCPALQPRIPPCAFTRSSPCPARRTPHDADVIGGWFATRYRFAVRGAPARDTVRARPDSIREYRGVYESGFEVSWFHPCDATAGDDTWWVTLTKRRVAAAGQSGEGIDPGVRGRCSYGGEQPSSQDARGRGTHGAWVTLHAGDAGAVAQRSRRRGCTSA
jgi:hypothetical protein